MKLSDLMLHDWVKHINYDLIAIFGTAVTPPPVIPSPQYEYIQVTEETLKKDWTYIDQLRPIALTPEILIVNNFYFNTDKCSYDINNIKYNGFCGSEHLYFKCSYDFNYDGGLVRLVFPTSIFSLMTTELTLFFDTFKFHGYCYSVDKFQKLTRTCGLIDLANNFKI